MLKDSHECTQKKKRVVKQLISVIIPVYNAEKYLDNCIYSIANQTYKNIEILIVDDGSTDKSYEICNNWRKKDPRVQVCHKKNEGPGVARNIGLNMAHGEYITFVDSDDWIESLMYENMIKIAESTGSDIVGCPSLIEYDDGSCKLNFSDVSEGYLDKTQCIIDFLEGNRHAWGAVHNKLYKSDLLDDIKFPATKHLEDYYVNAKLFNRANKIWFCAYPYYHHISNTTSLSLSGWNDGWFSIPETTNMIIEYLRSDCAELRVVNATYRFRFIIDTDIMWAIYKAKALKPSKQFRTKMAKRSIVSFLGYTFHARKKLSDSKRILKYFLSLVG